MKIYLIRHGMTKANEKRAYSGREDLSLSDKGIEELKTLKRSVVYPENGIIISSPMKRCIETTHILFPDKKIHDFEEGLCEINFGVFEGKTYDELKENMIYRNWINHYETISPLGGERFQDFKTRILKTFEGIVNTYNKEDDLIIVAHGGVIRMIMCTYIDKNKSFYEWDVPHGLGYEVEWESKKYNIIKDKKED